MTREERESRRADRAGQRSPDRVQPLRRGVSASPDSMGEVYGLPRHVFDEERIERWAERRGALVKVDRGRRARDGERLSRGRRRRCRRAWRGAGDDDAARVPAAARRYHAVHARDRRADGVGRRGARLEDERVRELGRDRRRAALLRRQVRQPARVDRRDAAADATSCAAFATTADADVVYDAEHRRSPLALRRRVEYHGFELEREIEAIDEFPPALADGRGACSPKRWRAARRGIRARARIRPRIESVRETYRRSGGATPRLSFADLAATVRAAARAT